MRVKDALKPIVECWKFYSGDDGFEDEYVQMIVLSSTGSLKKKEREYLKEMLSDDGYDYAVRYIKSKKKDNQQDQVTTLMGMRLH